MSEHQSDLNKYCFVLLSLFENKHRFRQVIKVNDLLLFIVDDLSNIFFGKFLHYILEKLFLLLLPKLKKKMKILVIKDAMFNE